MGSAKAKGAGAGAVTGAAAGSSFGPWGTAIGGVAGGAIGYFGTSEPPEYQQPAQDPAFNQLLMDQSRQRVAAVGEDVQRSTSSFAARYGVGPGGDTANPTSMNPANVLARYGAMLAKAGG